VPDSLAPEFVEPLLRGRFGRPYRYAESCPSTQRLLSEDDTEGTVAVAEEQSEGRGRLGRSWHAPARSSVLFSVLLKPAVPSPRLPELSVVAGRAVAAAVAEATGVQPDVKLPNDVLVAGKKVAGILAESSDGRVRLGVGVNANQTADELPSGTDTPPTSLRLETGGPIDRARLLSEILSQLEQAYDAWIRETGASG
jgi:BirA family transcriptional regulator, biotin operon repressor / biotin---[acetyl-CoA-carboxylase] ligase